MRLKIAFEQILIFFYFKLKKVFLHDFDVLMSKIILKK